MTQCEYSDQLGSADAAEASYSISCDTQRQGAAPEASAQPSNISEPCTPTSDRRHGGKKRSRESKESKLAPSTKDPTENNEPDQVALANLPFDVCGLLTDLNIDAVQRKVLQWRAALLRVTPHFSMWCGGPDRNLMQLLRDEGCGFACANAEQVSQLVSLGTPLQTVVFAQPVAPRMHLRCMKRWGVNLVSFAGAAQLRKVALEFPGARLVLNAALTSSAGQVSAAVPRCGAGHDEWAPLFALAKELKVHIAGVALQPSTPMARLGLSRCHSAQRGLARALHVAREVFDLALEHGHSLNLLDLGTSISDALDVTSDEGFSQSAAQIALLLEKYFPSIDYPRLRLFAELAGFLRQRPTAAAPESGNDDECTQNSESQSSEAKHGPPC